jgi:hypothetical protein
MSEKFERIAQQIDQIDERTKSHTTFLENMRVDMRALQAASVEQSKAIASNTDRIASSLEKFADKALTAAIAKPQSSFDLRLGIMAVICIGIITGIFILAFTGKDFSAKHDGRGTELNVGKP